MAVAMHSPRLTDERLRNWLNSDQLSRERLCQAVLSLDRRFKDVRPRHPQGGPDQGRDLEATYQDGRPAWAAIGFLNSANESPAHKRSVKRKFRDDLERALGEKSDLKVFVFITNARLTISEKEGLERVAKKQGINVCDIVDRERLRIALDSPEGLGFRFQYLGIPQTMAVS